MKNKQFNPEKRVPLWQKLVGYLNIFIIIGQLGLPTIAHAFIAFDEGLVEQTLNYDPVFTKVSNSDIQFKKSEYVVEQSQNKSVTHCLPLASANVAVLACVDTCISISSN